MKDWKQIISDYEQGNVYLAESAQILIQNIVYEIPAMKKHSQKLEQVQTECDKKEANAKKRINELEHDFRKQCHQLGVEGEKIKQEVLSLARGLPTTYHQISASAITLKDAVSEYQDFIQAQLEEENVKVVENLSFLILHGNTTTYQWKYGEKPISVEEPELDLDEKEVDDDNDDGGTTEIDFGDDIDFGDGDAIDFGDNNDAADEIDFGEAEIDFGAGEDIDYGAGLDMDSIDTSNIVVEEGGLAGGVARNDEALSILDNRRTRTIIVDELEELLGFLTQRLIETESNNMKIFISCGAQNTDPATLRTMINSVERLISSLTEVKIQQLQMIRDSPAYADRIVDNLKQKRRLKDKVEVSITELRRRKNDAIDEESRGKEQIKLVQEKTNTLQQQIEADLSKRYKGRPVFISGK